MLLALLLVGGCGAAGRAGQGFDGRAKQADERLPAAARFYDEAERGQVEEAQEHQQAARKAVEEGNLEKARVEFAAAAERYSRFADSYPASEWRLSFRFKAAELSLFGEQRERAAEQADKVLADPAASLVTRAMAAQLSGVAWRGIAKQKEKAGELEPIRLATAEQRGGAALAPRPPPEPWQRFIAAVDAYLRVWEKHPEIARRPADRNLALPPWDAALIAAEVEYASDRMEEARRRLRQIVETWPGEAVVMHNTVQLLLQTYLVLGDDRGFLSAKADLEKTLEAQAEKADEARAKETFLALRDRVLQTEQWLAFTAAKRLFDAGTFAEAAEGFERFAAEHASSTEASAGLWNAALAWEKVQRPEKAVAAREAIVAKHPDSAWAPLAALYLASGASKAGDHEAAARHYAGYLERWPEAPNRCVALQNVAFELDVQGKGAEAAERFLAFGTDGRCAKERPNEAAKGLVRGGKLFVEARQKARAREAFEAATRLQGVTDASAKKLVEDAKRQAKRL
jgi:hypothetical protein